MINKRYYKLFNNFEVLKQTDAKHRVSLDNIAQVKKELKDIKNIGKFTSKKSNVFSEIFLFLKNGIIAITDIIDIKITLKIAYDIGFMRFYF